jgi:hypothetical protein
MGGKITLLSGMQPAEEFSTLVHEIAHLCGVRIYMARLGDTRKDEPFSADRRHIL